MQDDASWHLPLNESLGSVGCGMRQLIPTQHLMEASPSQREKTMLEYDWSHWLAGLQTPPISVQGEHKTIAEMSKKFNIFDEKLMLQLPF